MSSPSSISTQITLELICANTNIVIMIACLAYLGKERIDLILRHRFISNHGSPPSMKCLLRYYISENVIEGWTLLSINEIGSTFSDSMLGEASAKLFVCSLVRLLILISEQPAFESILTISKASSESISVLMWQDSSKGSSNLASSNYLNSPAETETFPWSKKRFFCFDPSNSKDLNVEASDI